MPGFPTTSWSLVIAAAGPSKDALESLCRTYWRPVYVFVRAQGNGLEESKDLTQAFFARLLEKNYLAAADRERGKFRSFLLTSVKNFLANERDRAHALKRGGPQLALSIDSAENEDWCTPEVIDRSTPESLFERRWALALLERAMSNLRAGYAGNGKLKQFEQLSVFLDDDSTEGRYDAVAAQMGVTAGAVRIAVHRLRRKHREFLRNEIANTVSEPNQIDDELRFLLSALSAE